MALYLQAAEKEFRAMSASGVLRTSDRNEVPAQSEIGQLIVLLTRKRDGRYKSRLAYNGRRQKYKITEHYASPILRPETLSCALAISTVRGYDFLGANVSTAFYTLIYLKV